MAYPAVTINTELGDIEVELWNDVAPAHAENFLKLAKKSFYDGLIFHRVIPGFVIQGGCPKGDGTGGPGWQVKAEFNKKKHMPGTLSMARSAHPDSAGSQFFVCLTRAMSALGQSIHGVWSSHQGHGCCANDRGFGS